MASYHGDESYESLSKYMKEAETILARRSNQATMKRDAMTVGMLRQYGKENLLNLKRDNYNLKLEDCVIGADQHRMVDIVNNHLVPRTGLIFLTPNNKYGCAPFYSSVKVIGSHPVKTLWFNLSVMLFMCIITTMLLLSDCPGKYLRK